MVISAACFIKHFLLFLYLPSVALAEEAGCYIVEKSF